MRVDFDPVRVLAALFFVLFLLQADAASAKPNIVVIMTDDQEDTGSMAYMPKVQSLLAKRGITFTNSFVNFPICCPSRVSFLTGQAAHNHGIRANDLAKGGGWPMFRDGERNALPVWLQAAGYQTALVGKYLNLYGQHDVEAEKVRGSKNAKKQERGDSPRETQEEKREARRDAKREGKESAAGYVMNLIESYMRPYVSTKRAAAKSRIQAAGRSAEASFAEVPPGWNLWYAFSGNAKYYRYKINDNGKLVSFKDQPGDYSTDVLRDRAVQFIQDQSHGQSPFFLFIATKATHGGHGGGQGISTPAPRHVGKYADFPLPNDPSFNEEDVSHKPVLVQEADLLDDDAKQLVTKAYRSELESLQSVDDLVEAVVKALADTGKLDDTIIVFTSDNGFVYGSHRLVGKMNAYEGSIRVPLVIRGPGIPEDQTRSQLVNNLDLVATIEQLAGAKPARTEDGRSLVPLFTDANAPWRGAILVEGGHEAASPTRRFTVVRTATEKYVKYGDGFEELYDLAKDPYELDNKADDDAYAGDLKTLRAEAETLQSCSGETCWIP